MNDLTHEQTDFNGSQSGAVYDYSEYQYPSVDIFPDQFSSALTDSIDMLDTMDFPVIMGRDSIDRMIVEDMGNRPNLLLAGTTGSGKTEFIYSQLFFLLMRKHPTELKLILCGSKNIDYGIFSPLANHFLACDKKIQMIVDLDGFLDSISGLNDELNERLRLFSLAGVKTIRQYNQVIIEGKMDGHHFLPDILLVVDDLYNFAYSDEVVHMLITVLQKNAHTGIFVLACTSQIYSPNINKQLKSNFVFRVAMRVMSQADSRKILDMPGAEKLTFPGELIYNLTGTLMRTRQLAISFKELQKLVSFISSQKSYPGIYMLFNPQPVILLDPSKRDALFESAARLIVMYQQGSTSLIQRKLKLGYNRAQRIIDQLEQSGVIGPFEGSKAREVFIPDEYSLEIFLDNGLKSMTNHIEPEETETISSSQSVNSERINISPLANQSRESAKFSMWYKLKKKLGI